MRKGERRGLTTKKVRNVETETGNQVTEENRAADSRTPPPSNHVISPERSAMMARIGQRNTAPELAVRRMLHSLGARFRLHRRDLPGTPDIVLPRRKLVLLVHGCFWHRHHGCSLAYMPKSRVDFWQGKFAHNVERDANVQRKLVALGWGVHVLWECETRDVLALEHSLRKVLRLSEPDGKRPG